MAVGLTCPNCSFLFSLRLSPVSILQKSTAGRYRPVRVADGLITARCSFIKNASWEPPRKAQTVYTVHFGLQDGLQEVILNYRWVL